MGEPIFDFRDNPDQAAFVLGEEMYSGYFGGVGAGKTFGNIVRGLRILTHPDNEGYPEKPRGLIGAESKPVFDDILLPQWEKIQNMLKYRAPSSNMIEKEYIRSKTRAILRNGARMDLRSLGNPQNLRGRELAYYGIDEGRNVSLEAWKRLYDRLRQPVPVRAGAVTSTPNGYDWLYDVFHPESSEKWFDPSTGEPFKWYNAPTTANAKNLDPVYVAGLKANLSGDELEQEFYGRFLGKTQGSVFPQWTKGLIIDGLVYHPGLPLYSFWDFGIGDPGVVLFAQIEQVHRVVDGFGFWIPHLYILDGFEHADWAARDWADWFHGYVYEHFGRSATNGNYGDPAGARRDASSGTSVIDDLGSAGVPIIPASKKAPDWGIRIITNLISGRRILVSRGANARFDKAMSSHRWPLDKDGRRKGNQPIHDWTSHWVSALRYGATALVGFYPGRSEKPAEPPPPPGTIGAAINSILRSSGPTPWLGPRNPASGWTVGKVG